MMNWKERHAQAWVNPKPGFEQALVGLTKAISIYAQAYEEEFEEEDTSQSTIHHDGVLGPAFIDIVEGIRTLLNGPTGMRLDAGTIDSLLYNLLSKKEQ